MNNKLTPRQFAHKLGEQERLTLAASLPIHKRYVAGDNAVRAALRVEWAVGFISGKGKVSEERAEAIWKAGKGSAAIDAALVNRATRTFDHHVVRGSVSNGKREGAKPVRISREVRASFETYVLNLGLPKATLRALFKSTLDGIK